MFPYPAMLSFPYNMSYPFLSNNPYQSMQYPPQYAPPPINPSPPINPPSYNQPQIDYQGQKPYPENYPQPMEPTQQQTPPTSDKDHPSIIKNIGSKLIGSALQKMKDKGQELIKESNSQQQMQNASFPQMNNDSYNLPPFDANTSYSQQQMQNASFPQMNNNAPYNLPPFDANTSYSQQQMQNASFPQMNNDSYNQGNTYDNLKDRSMFDAVALENHEQQNENKESIENKSVEQQSQQVQSLQTLTPYEVPQNMPYYPLEGFVGTTQEQALSPQNSYSQQIPLSSNANNSPISKDIQTLHRQIVFLPGNKEYLILEKPNNQDEQNYSQQKIWLLPQRQYIIFGIPTNNEEQAQVKEMQTMDYYIPPQEGDVQLPYKMN